MVVNLFWVAQNNYNWYVISVYESQWQKQSFFFMVSFSIVCACVFPRIAFHWPNPSPMHFTFETHDHTHTHTNIKCIHTFPIVLALKLRAHFELHNYWLGSDCRKSTEACLFAKFTIYTKLHVWHVSCTIQPLLYIEWGTKSEEGERKIKSEAVVNTVRQPKTSTQFKSKPILSVALRCNRNAKKKKIPKIKFKLLVWLFGYFDISILICDTVNAYKIVI